MEQLEVLPSTAILSKRIRRVLGQNPGKFTLQGTNTYLIGSKPPFLLLDTGEGKESYPPLLEKALLDESSDSSGGLSELMVSDIIISHRHHDHHGGLPSVLSVLRQIWSNRNPSAPFPPPKIHKYPLPQSQTAAPDFHATLSALPSDSYQPDGSGQQIHDLHDRQVITVPDSTLIVFHTPGHTIDSICLYLREENAIFTADSVLGQGSAVFEDLSTYISSLKGLIDDENGLEIGTLYPGHGPVVAEGKKTIQMYIDHRLQREEQIVALLETIPPDGTPAWSAGTIVSTLYAAYPQSLWPAAERGVILHLRKLAVDGRAKTVGTDGWELIS